MEKTPLPLLSALNKLIQNLVTLYLYQPKKGGHMGYIARQVTPYGDRRWMDYAVLEWVQELHKGLYCKAL